MQPNQGKTAVAFHAKDDLPEVRREVLALLLRHELRFYAVVRDKRQTLAYVRQRNEREADYRYNENELYDSLVRHLFKRRFHQADHFEIAFARRGRSDRNKAIRRATFRIMTRNNPDLANGWHPSGMRISHDDRKPRVASHPGLMADIPLGWRRSEPGGFSAIGRWVSEDRKLRVASHPGLMADIPSGWRRSEPGGFLAISRWLSEATPPECDD